MTSITELNTIYISEDQFPALFTRQDVIKNGIAPVILDAIAKPTENQEYVIELFVPKWINIDDLMSRIQIKSTSGELELSAESTAHFTFLRAQVSTLDALSLSIDEFQTELPLSEVSDTFAGANVAILVSNQNTPEQISDWLNYHKKVHNLDAAIIVDRLSQNGNEEQRVKKIQKNIESDKLNVVTIPTPLPLGKAEPSERTVWMCPTAPGKEKMEEPPIDPWESELEGNVIVEIVRARYLSNPRGVILMQVSDFIPPMKTNIFDSVVESEAGFLRMAGQKCYPWRVRRNDTARHGDHCCVIFSDNERNKAWALSGDSARFDLPWQLYRVGSIKKEIEEPIHFWRAMGLRHFDPNDNNPTLAPRTALIREENLIKLAKKRFNWKPVEPPQMESPKVIPAKKSGRRLIVTTMKNEGPFLLEWIAYNKAIGFDDIIVFTNDCTDGTDEFFDLLHDRGIVEHRQNPYREVNLKPQHAALFDAANSKLYKAADWKICMDVDEFANIKVGNGTLDDLFEAVGNANMIALTWRLIGNSGVVDFIDQPIIGQFDRAAHQMTRFPHQAWGIKTLFRDLGYYKKMGVHRPKGLRPERMEGINWVNGSGKQLPESFYRTSWRTGSATVGYDLVELNHYAVRSMESFLVKRDRGRVNHVDRDQGMHYWFRMNHNVVEENSIMKRIPMMEEELAKLMSDPDIARMHQKCVDAHRAKIDELKARESYQDFFADIKSDRMQTMSEHTNRFGMNVFFAGPNCVSDENLQKIRTGELDYFNVNPDGIAFET